jgi:hypothetical protein
MANKNTALPAEILQRHFNNFLLAIGSSPSELSDRAKEYLTAAMIEYADSRLNDFCCHLNTYDGLAECRFDFMLIDFQAKSPS